MGIEVAIIKTPSNPGIIEIQKGIRNIVDYLKDEINLLTLEIGSY
jgi:hypothetical protein